MAAYRDANGIDYEEAEYPGLNDSGLTVYGRNVLVKMDGPMRVTAGGVYLPDENFDLKAAGAETGCLYMIGPEAWRRFDDGTAWRGPHAEVGDRVYVAKYSGLVARGVNGYIFRVMDYNCVVAGLDKTAIFTRIAGEE